jgi:hypothetical protein
LAFDVTTTLKNDGRSSLLYRAAPGDDGAAARSATRSLSAPPCFLVFGVTTTLKNDVRSSLLYRAALGGGGVVESAVLRVKKIFLFGETGNSLLFCVVLFCYLVCLSNSKKRCLSDQRASAQIENLTRRTLVDGGTALSLTLVPIN